MTTTHRSPTALATGAAVLAGLVVWLGFAALPSVSGAAARHRGAKIELRATARGKILADGAGQTLFVFSRDSGGQNRCAPQSGCSGTWPAIVTHGKPRAGSGVVATKLGTIKLPGGSRQVTYAGHPLYRYAPEPAPGLTDYLGASSFGGIWRALRASGKLVG